MFQNLGPYTTVSANCFGDRAVPEWGIRNVGHLSANPLNIRQSGLRILKGEAYEAN